MVRLVALAAALLLMASALAARSHGQDLVVSGSTGVLPAAEEAARAMSARGQPVTVMAGGSLLGLTLVERGDVGIALSEVRPRPPLHAVVLGQLPVAVVAHRDTGADRLTMDDLRAIVSGAVSDWSQIGGHPLRLTLFFRTPVSGVRIALLQLLLGGADVTARSVNALSNGDVLLGVRRTPGAVGFVEGVLRPEGVVVLAVGGLYPGERGYPLMIPVYAGYRGRLSAAQGAYLAAVRRLLR